MQIGYWRRNNSNERVGEGHRKKQDNWYGNQHCHRCTIPSTPSPSSPVNAYSLTRWHFKSKKMEITLKLGKHVTCYIKYQGCLNVSVSQCREMHSDA